MTPITKIDKYRKNAEKVQHKGFGFDFGFVFSDDIEKWMKPIHRQTKEQKDRYYANRKKKWAS